MTAVSSHPNLEVRGIKGSGAGRRLHALRSFAPGELITAFRDPILVLPNGPSSKVVCNHCLAHNVPTKACTGCKAVSYCGTSCQKAHWGLIHKSECKSYRKVKASVDQDWLPTPVRALLQVLLRWDSEPELRSAFASLEGNVTKFKLREDIWKDIGLQAYGGMTYAGRTENDEQLHLARDILCKIQTNSFDRTDVDTGQAGIFLHPTLAMINHSCIPNANVVFVKRQALLRAEAPIREGDEINISYIDYTKPKLFRQLGLALYHFNCDCPRCKDDLSVYEACQNSPVVPLNSFSLVPNLQQLRKPTINPPKSKKELQEFKDSIEEIYIACQPPDPSQGPRTIQQRLAYLQHQWRQCQPLIQAGMWAQEPLSLTIEHAIMYYTETGSYAHALSLACFAALHSAPYKYPAPFKERRLKGLMIIAKTLTNTAPPSAMEELTKVTDHRVMVCLLQADQVAMCEALALMVEKYGPMAHSEEWEILDLARSTLQDIASLPGREKEASLLRAWAGSRDEAGTKYFKEQILMPIKDLAGFAVDIMTSDFDTDEPILEVDKVD
ncbi:SET domain and MYND-type zinc finger protein 6 [Cytospora mali]|uniref:SET domain and MYND-type zinc finger protein 6 n=1 Tax=Cytospora mali TaxID=578113 RepID=A0A194VEW5_CYTMA|nr:SET domain and MYND-type zinc finger protein 6 [Valsa mali var. pyri (nom. inval.)]